LKKLFFATSPEKNFLNEINMTMLRISAGLLMAYLHGLGKIPPSEKLIGAIASMGFPVPDLFAWLAGLAELIGGLMLAIGLLTRPAALFFSITMFVAAFGKHLHDPWEVKELSLLYLFIGLIFLSKGSGRISIDHFIK
jgi:putative oxidoreductase